MTYLYIQRVRKIMKSICESCFNDSGTIIYMQNSASATIDQEGTMMACEVAEEKKRKMVVSGPSEGSPSAAALKYRMIYTPPAGQPRHPLPQFWGIAHSSSSSSTTTLHQHNSSSSRWQSGHHSSLHLPVTRATIVGKLATSPRTVVSLCWVMHLVFQLLG
jgi:hypothetical protein